jgi:hypothetical protein
MYQLRHAGQKVVVDLVDLPERIFPIGRLDKDSTGLLLLTNDGPLHHHLSHPSFDHEKEYEVTVQQPIDDEVLRQLAKACPSWAADASGPGAAAQRTAVSHGAAGRAQPANPAHGAPGGPPGEAAAPHPRGPHPLGRSTRRGLAPSDTAERDLLRDLHLPKRLRRPSRPAGEHARMKSARRGTGITGTRIRVYPRRCSSALKALPAVPPLRSFSVRTASFSRVSRSNRKTDLVTHHRAVAAGVWGRGPQFKIGDAVGDGPVHEHRVDPRAARLRCAIFPSRMWLSKASASALMALRVAPHARRLSM